MNKILSERLHYKDDILNSKPHPKTLWARTKIIGGYDLCKNNSGVSSLGEIVFETENMVPLIGVQYAMETIFGVKGSLNIPTLNETMQIGALGVTPLKSVLESAGMPYLYGQKVCLFGVGVGGAAENNITALEVKYNETNVSDMVPFRFTNSELDTVDSNKYYGKKITDDGYIAYYLKRFDTDPVIKHLYKNGEEGEDGSDVDNTYFESYSETGVQTFTELVLTISKKDVREWFQYNGNIEESRVNSIGLFTAVYDEVEKDYAQIQLFSKLNIPTEPLSLTKDMNIIYRVYGA